MAFGLIARGAISSPDTDEELFDFSVDSDVDLTVCNQNSSSVTLRIAVVDGALGDVATEDYVFYDYAMAGNETLPALQHEAISANELILIRASSTGVSFRLSGEGS